MGVGAIALFVGGIFGVVYFGAPGGRRMLDNQFGDQHLKTSVALIELHKTRYGRYPESLSDLKFTGQWDQIALQSVRYYPNADRTEYYIEVETGWIGKPELKMPNEFWRGTGYDPALKTEGLMETGWVGQLLLFLGSYDASSRSNHNYIVVLTTPTGSILHVSDFAGHSLWPAPRGVAHHSPLATIS